MLYFSLIVVLLLHQTILFSHCTAILKLFTSKPDHDRHQWQYVSDKDLNNHEASITFGRNLLDDNWSKPLVRQHFVKAIGSTEGLAESLNPRIQDSSSVLPWRREKRSRKNPQPGGRPRPTYGPGQTPRHSQRPPRGGHDSGFQRPPPTPPDGTMRPPFTPGDDSRFPPPTEGHISLPPPSSPPPPSRLPPPFQMELFRGFQGIRSFAGNIVVDVKR